MKNTFLRPVIDQCATGENIKNIRKNCGLSVKDLQEVFGFEFPQAIYAWERGKNIPTIDNLLVLASLFGVSVDNLVVTRFVEIETENIDSAVKICKSA